MKQARERNVESLVACKLLVEDLQAQLMLFDFRNGPLRHKVFIQLVARVWNASMLGLQSMACVKHKCMLMVTGRAAQQTNKVRLDQVRSAQAGGHGL